MRPIVDDAHHATLAAQPASSTIQSDPVGAR